MSVSKPKPLKVFGRTHYACLRCKMAKIRCLGEKPSCLNCVLVHKGDQCVYPLKDRKVVFMELDLNKLHQRVQQLEAQLAVARGDADEPEGLAMSPSAMSPGVSLTPTLTPTPSVPGVAGGMPTSSLGPPSSLSVPPSSLSGPPSSLSGPPSLTVAPSALSAAAPTTLATAPTTLATAPTVAPTALSAPLSTTATTTTPELDVYTTLVAACRQLLPPKELAMDMVRAAYIAYGQEFYLTEWEWAAAAYDYVAAAVHQQPLPPPPAILPPLAACQLGPELVQLVGAYLLALIAFGQQLLHRAVLPENQYPGLDLYLLAEHMLRVNTEHLLFHHIQTALLLGLYAANLGRYNACYLFIGVATRLAVALNLHRHRDLADVGPPAPLVAPPTLGAALPPPLPVTPATPAAIRAQAEAGKRLWWLVFVLDTIWLHHLIVFQYTDTDVDLPAENLLVDDLFGVDNLDINVQLCKYVAKHLRLLYGPNIRTFSVNYINSDEFNHRQKLDNILHLFDELRNHFEELLLAPRAGQLDRKPRARVLTNVFLRYHNAVFNVCRPLFAAVYEPLNAPVVAASRERINTAVRAVLAVLCATMELMARLRSHDQVYTLSFWDLNYMWQALLVMAMAAVNGCRFRQWHKGMALLQWMASCGNVHAITCVSRVASTRHMLLERLQVDVEPPAGSGYTGLDPYLGYLPPMAIDADPGDFGWLVDNIPANSQAAAAVLTEILELD